LKFSLQRVIILDLGPNLKTAGPFGLFKHKELQMGVQSAACAFDGLGVREQSELLTLAFACQS
ncbi:MAG: hypothetical protein AAF368_02010, partial [Planctomycetota bacterium]